jgi:hypothetical protein
LLFLLAVLTILGLSILSPSRQVMAENVARTLDAAAFRADASVAHEQKCEDREVEADEGYGISRKEMRRVCK